MSRKMKRRDSKQKQKNLKKIRGDWAKRNRKASRTWLGKIAQDYSHLDNGDGSGVV